MVYQSWLSVLVVQIFYAKQIRRKLFISRGKDLWIRASQEIVRNQNLQIARLAFENLHLLGNLTI